MTNQPALLRLPNIELLYITVYVPAGFLWSLCFCQFTKPFLSSHHYYGTSILYLVGNLEVYSENGVLIFGIEGIFVTVLFMNISRPT